MTTNRKPRLSPDGVPIDGKDWTAADWADLYAATEQARQQIAARHRVPARCWRVGVANDPQPEDRVYEDEQAAIQAAHARHEALGFGVPVAVWDERDEPRWVFLLGEQFRRV